METMDAILGRRSIRSFRDEPVSDDEIRILLDAARAAPSAGNLQARDFFVVRSPSVRSRLAEAAHGQEFVARAPVLFVICANMDRITPYGQRGSTLYCIQDSAASCQNILLAAHDMGLGACWVGAFDGDAVSGILSLPAYLKPVAMVPVGHPDQAPAEGPKRDDDIHIADGAGQKI